MKFFFKISLILLLAASCKSYNSLLSPTANTQNKVVIDAYNTVKDKIQVSFYPTKQLENEIDFFLPKIIPGTYSIDNYGQFIENIKAYDASGATLKITQKDTSAWKISNAKRLHKIEYTVNDSFDIEKDHDVFSPAGTNIEHHRNYILNLHGFVGYLNNQTNQPFNLKVKHHKNLSLGCSQTISNSKSMSNIAENSFSFDRYATLIDTPIFLSRYTLETFKINDITVTLGVHSPNKHITAKDLLPSMKKMMSAQKHFMGGINHTNTYSIFLYLANRNQNSPKGYGALEHSNSTVVVLPAALPLKEIKHHLIDVVSHEFFHIITPLAIHSKEIHNFDYNHPKMSKHLWMYEGVTEYFANLFQVKEGLITRETFFNRIAHKIERSKKYQDDLSFTLMSKHILEEPYKSNYANVYEKGALIAMCIDILIRESSNGEKNILDMMYTLSEMYGTDMPFNDIDLFEHINDITSPSVFNFLNEHVEKGTPIDYNYYLNKIGVSLQKETTTAGFFQNGEILYISPETTSNEIYFNEMASESDFLKQLGIQEKDVLIAVNNKKFDLNNANYLLDLSQKWVKGSKVSFTIRRENKVIKYDTLIKTTPVITHPIIVDNNSEALIKYL